MTQPLRILSLGAGVQSTTMALMAAHGEITPMPDCAIFADTGAEPGPTYEHLEWLSSGNVLPFPVHVVQQGDLRAEILASAGDTEHRAVSIPFHGVSDKGTDMMARRQCTEEFKIRPIRRKIREMLGGTPRAGAEQWIGISQDEYQRAKPSRVQYIVDRWPLLELGMRRWDCLQWLKRNDYPEPPKSACTFCPFRSNEQWRWLRDNDPDGFKQAIELDAAVRAGASERWKSKLYLHRDRKPLSEVDIRSDEERGQLSMITTCEGMCGV